MLWVSLWVYIWKYSNCCCGKWQTIFGCWNFVLILRLMFWAVLFNIFPFNQRWMEVCTQKHSSRKKSSTQNGLDGSQFPSNGEKKFRKYNEQYNFLRRKSIKLMKSGFIICMVRVVPNQSFVQHMHDLQNGIHAFFSLCSKRLMCFRQCVQQRMKYVGFSFFHSNLRNGSDKFCSKLRNGWSKQKSLWTIDKNFLKSKITNASKLFSAEKNGKNWRKNTTSDWK